VRAEGGVAVDDDMGMQLAAVTQNDVFADDAMRTDGATQADLGFGVNDGRGVVHGSSERQFNGRVEPGPMLFHPSGGAEGWSGLTGHRFRQATGRRTPKADSPAGAEVVNRKPQIHHASMSMKVTSASLTGSSPT